MQFAGPSQRSILVVVTFLLAVVLIIALAPSEATLGDSIRYVYLHVALIWTTIVAFVVAAALGLVVTFTDSERLHIWMERTAWVATGCFALAVVASMVASWANWGAIAWNEPRTNVLFTTLALAVIFQVVNSWLPRRRLNGFINLLIPLLLFLFLERTPLELHPRDPIGSSPSTAIRLTFYGLFAVFLVGAAWLVAALTSVRTGGRAGRLRGE